ncbi:MAG: hypothetical protein JSW64_11635 [Candidatus Zixiibacteriota bacterium]|nr:MAG: hypothetical protein JSW64_11635 [candidate division Zixibacteria bacterium]
MKKTTITLMIFVSAAFLIFIGCERKVIIENSEVSLTGDCFSCHGEDGLLLAAQGEWLNSVHASGTSVDYTNRGGSDCSKCHSHQGFLEFLETGEVSPPYDQVSAIHCFTCHAPHETGTLELRADEPVELQNGEIFDYGKGNLCVHCHYSRFDVRTITDNYEQTSSRFGAHHGPQGDLIAGTGGYEIDGYSYRNSGHATAVRDACAGCHMGQPERIHDGYKIGGHSFNMVDEDTGSDLSVLCQACHSDIDDYDYTADADHDYDGEIEGYQTEVDGLLDSLAILLIAEGVLDSTNHRPIEDITIADGNVMGALHNYGIVEEDRSHGIHNYKYIVDLLQSSVDYLD